MSEEIRIKKDFLLKELPVAPHSYVCVWLMLQAKTDATTAEIAEVLAMPENEVIRAKRYWAEKDGSVAIVARKTEKPDTIKIDLPKAEPIVAWQTKPDYTSAELSEYMKNDSMKNLLHTAQRKLGKPLTRPDISTIFSFHDWLGLPLDVIDVLLSYCVTDGFKGMNYMEKVAIGWAKDGINSVEKAAEYIEMRKKGYGAIMRAFGQSGRMPVEGEEVLMRKWLMEYALPLEVVTHACERSVMQTGKVSFQYADTILSNWKTAGVKSLEDVQVLDKAFEAKKNQQQLAKPEQKVQPKPQKPNRFINYEQRSWDFAEIDRLQREERDKW